jgi:hypothetical protein
VLGYGPTALAMAADADGTPVLDAGHTDRRRRARRCGLCECRAAPVDGKSLSRKSWRRVLGSTLHSAELEGHRHVDRNG